MRDDYDKGGAHDETFVRAAAKTGQPTVTLALPC
jgi:hypothetical protein